VPKIFSIRARIGRELAIMRLTLFGQKPAMAFAQKLRASVGLDRLFNRQRLIGLVAKTPPGASGMREAPGSSPGAIAISASLAGGENSACGIPGDAVSASQMMPLSAHAAARRLHRLSDTTVITPGL
jgi:hypothetical protein